jgi:prepilin-type processing-associated H-X9-DG protein
MTHDPGNREGHLVRANARPAIQAMTLGIIAILLTWLGVGVLLGIGAILKGIFALVRINRDPVHFAGNGFAIAGIVLGIIAAAAIVPIVLIFLHVRELERRTACASNFRELGACINTYASDNGDIYPVVPYAPYSAANAGTSTVTAPPGGTIGDAAKWVFTGHAQDGSPLASMWLLMLSDHAVPQFFICKSDPWNAGWAKTSAGSAFYTSFPSQNQISYSFAYPWTQGKSGAAVAPWWRMTMNSDIVLGADMAPVNTTGKPGRNVCPSSAPAAQKTWNTGNHRGEGQNVWFADGHVEFAESPDVGFDRDNIYSTSGTGIPLRFGGSQPLKTPILFPAPTAPPYDIYLVPARNLDSGSL